MRISVSIVEYNVRELKKLVYKLVRKNMKDDTIIEKAAKKSVLVLIKNLPDDRVEGLLQLMCNNDIISKRVRSVLHDCINNGLKKINYRDEINIRLINYSLEDGNTVLIADIDNPDLDILTDVLLENMLGESYSDMYKLCAGINKDISEDDKYRLVMLILQWINETDSINIVIRNMIDNKTTIGKYLKPLELVIGTVNINLKHCK